MQHVGAEHWDNTVHEELVQDLLDDSDEDHRATVVMVMIRLMLELARADGLTVPAERDRITAIAARAFPESAVQVVAATERLVANEAAFLAGKISKGQFESAAKDAAAKAAAFGVPIVAVSAVGFTGLSAAGITSGLATLGFGGILGLSSMVTGIGTVVAVGVVVHQGVRYVLGTNERGREKKREYLMQQVLLNHQRAIEDLTTDISGLARRMEEQFTRTTANEDQLAALRVDLAAFQAALSQLQSSKESVEQQAAEA